MYLQQAIACELRHPWYNPEDMLNVNEKTIRYEYHGCISRSIQLNDEEVISFANKVSLMVMLKQITAVTAVANTWVLVLTGYVITTIVFCGIKISTHAMAMHQRTGSGLNQVMAWHQNWSNEAYSFESWKQSSTLQSKYTLRNVTYKISTILFRPQYAKYRPFHSGLDALNHGCFVQEQMC